LIFLYIDVIVDFFGVIERRGARNIEIFEVVFFIVLIKVIFLNFITFWSISLQKKNAIFSIIFQQAPFSLTPSETGMGAGLRIGPKLFLEVVSLI